MTCTQYLNSIQNVSINLKKTFLHHPFHLKWRFEQRSYSSLVSKNLGEKLPTCFDRFLGTIFHADGLLNLRICVLLVLLIYSCSSVSVYMLFVHCCFNLVSLLLLLFTVVHQLLLVCFVHLPLLCFVVRLPLCCSILLLRINAFWDKTFWKINLVDWEVISNTSSSCTLRADCTLFVKKNHFSWEFYLWKNTPSH